MLSQRRLPSCNGGPTSGLTILPGDSAWSWLRESADALHNASQSARCPTTKRTMYPFVRSWTRPSAPGPHLREHCALATWETARVSPQCLSLLSAVMNHFIWWVHRLNKIYQLIKPFRMFEVHFPLLFPVPVLLLLQQKFLFLRPYNIYC